MARRVRISTGSRPSGRTQQAVPVVSRNWNVVLRNAERCAGQHAVVNCTIQSPTMFALSPALQLLLMMFAGWVNRHQLRIIKYLKEENRVLKERLGDRPIHFTDAERPRLARKAKALGLKVLRELETLVTPDTLMRWYRELASRKWDYSPSACAGPSAPDEGYRRYDPAHGAGQSLLGLHPNQGSAR